MVDAISKLFFFVMIKKTDFFHILIVATPEIFITTMSSKSGMTEKLNSVKQNSTKEFVY